jgi:hypothetical protein
MSYEGESTELLREIRDLLQQAPSKTPQPISNARFVLRAFVVTAAFLGAAVCLVPLILFPFAENPLEWYRAHTFRQGCLFSVAMLGSFVAASSLVMIGFAVLHQRRRILHIAIISLLCGAAAFFGIGIMAANFDL